MAVGGEGGASIHLQGAWNAGHEMAFEFLVNEVMVQIPRSSYSCI